MKGKLLAGSGSLIGLGSILALLLTSENRSFFGPYLLAGLIAVAMICLSFGDKITHLFKDGDEDA